MKSFLIKRWFLVGLFSLIPIGLIVGTQLEPESISELSSTYAGTIGRIVVAIVLFLMSVTLDNRKLMASLRKPAPVIWACFANFGILPLLAIPLMSWQRTEDFSVGLMITASVPCTMAAASVWTRKAGGNDAVALLVTILTNGLCFAITPFWLRFGVGDTVSLDILKMVERLFVTALLPIVAGQVFRSFGSIRTLADNAKTMLGGVAQACILLLVFWASVKGGPHLRSTSNPALTTDSILIVLVSCVVLHIVALIISVLGSCLFGFSREDTAATAFAGSQKTLPIGIYIATDLLSGKDLPFAVFPILMFHASQLFLDTLIVDPLKGWVESKKTVTPTD